MVYLQTWYVSRGLLHRVQLVMDRWNCKYCIEMLDKWGVSRQCYSLQQIMLGGGGSQMPNFSIMYRVATSFFRQITCLVDVSAPCTTFQLCIEHSHLSSFRSRIQQKLGEMMVSLRCTRLGHAPSPSRFSSTTSRGHFYSDKSWSRTYNLQVVSQATCRRYQPDSFGLIKTLLQSNINGSTFHVFSSLFLQYSFFEGRSMQSSSAHKLSKISLAISLIFILTILLHMKTSKLSFLDNIYLCPKIIFI